MKHIILLISLFVFTGEISNAQFAARNQFFKSENYDVDAKAWIAAVETADGQALEAGVKNAMNQLVLDLKSNSLWTPIQTMVVKMGARTLAGALIDIKNPSTSWTNVNFVSGDYNRTTGLIGNGSSKYLNTGRNNNADGKDDFAMWTFITAKATGAGDTYMGAGALGTGYNGQSYIAGKSSTDLEFKSRSSTANAIASTNEAGLAGISRSGSANYTYRGGGLTGTITRTSQTPYNNVIFDHSGTAVGNAFQHSNHKSCASAIGAAHDLAAAETCMNTFVASIEALGL